MADALGIDWTTDWIRRTAQVVHDHRVELVTLDREIGDGDHGENLDRGFTAVIAKLDSLPADAVPGDALKLVATTLISTVGGASGPLLGTAYLKGAGVVGKDEQLDGAALVAFLTAARDGVVLRGKAEPGDKTMIDAWTPAVDAAVAAQAEGRTPAEILAAAADAAEKGAEATEPLVARKGRASYLGERAIGHRDPGAQSSSLILRAAADAAAGAGGTGTGTGTDGAGGTGTDGTTGGAA
ncbi:dihydroxyacetone kinase subunit DhaL [Herbiconiux sp. CPCC 205716]|uniref:Dihydroxyacetone kinase subunit DhaL n=1 Tax=Herbiconiux gentiana TaxID=2970912 RepID=A0ABT2GAL3_9MICO|nr:dihydroxyacetone kinase subunit DhaL [Herbiconiux gentiana]MCS5713230.1 dihydroxyacetone kinase subunit DhaL [Herbiconiux gentiana]